jgi:phytoene desaturase
MSTNKQTIAIIGAGIGGLSAAIRLAVAGWRVVVFEQNETVGGKMSEISAAGFRWDTGPSVITMRHVFEELFEIAGRRLDEYLTLQPVEPLTRYFYRDGTVLDATSNLAAMTRQIERIEPRDVEGYLRFLAYAARLHRITGPTFVYDEPPTMRRLLRLPLLDLFKVDPWLTMDGVIRRHVRSPHLRQLLRRFATYVGASPYLAPATLSVIAHVELTGGVWYPQGGVYAIAQALARLATELGVAIHTSTTVGQILVRNRQAQGVRLGNGAVIETAAVVANVDVATVYQKLLPTEATTPQRVRGLADLPTSCSGYVLLLGVRQVHPQLAHHNIFFPVDYRREFDDLFGRGHPPGDPTVYVAITAKSDPGHAPPGGENWFVLVNAPPLGPNFDWSTQEHAYRDVVFKTLARFGLDIQPHIRYTKVLTPVDLAERTGAWRGALYGISSHRALNAFRRPHNRDPHVRGLYFAGGTTHPGGGVPMVTLSAKVVAKMIEQDFSTHSSQRKG